MTGINQIGSTMRFFKTTLGTAAAGSLVLAAFFTLSPTASAAQSLSDCNIAGSAPAYTVNAIGQPKLNITIANPPVPVNIPPGVYTVVGSSFDDAHPAETPNEGGEQWYAIFYTANGTIIGDVSVGPDLPGDQQNNSFPLYEGPEPLRPTQSLTAPFTLKGTAASVVFKHAFNTSLIPQTVFATCLGLSPIDSTEATSTTSTTTTTTTTLPADTTTTTSTTTTTTTTTTLPADTTTTSTTTTTVPTSVDTTAGTTATTLGAETTTTLEPVTTEATTTSSTSTSTSTSTTTTTLAPTTAPIPTVSLLIPPEATLPPTTALPVTTQATTLAPTTRPATTRPATTIPATTRAATTAPTTKPAASAATAGPVTTPVALNSDGSVSVAPAQVAGIQVFADPADVALTGSDPMSTVAFGVSFLGIGALLVGASRRRRI